MMYLRLLIKSKRGISCFPSFFEVQSPVFFHARHPPPPRVVSPHFVFYFSSPCTLSDIPPPPLFLPLSFFLASCPLVLLPFSRTLLLLLFSRHLIVHFLTWNLHSVPRDRSLPAHPISTLKAQSRKKPTNLCAPHELHKEMHGPCLMIIKSC